MSESTLGCQVAAPKTDGHAAQSFDFDRRAVSANSKGRLDYQRRGARRGSCSLRCHDKDHVDQEY